MIPKNIYLYATRIWRASRLVAMEFICSSFSLSWARFERRTKFNVSITHPSYAKTYSILTGCCIYQDKSQDTAMGLSKLAKRKNTFLQHQDRHDRVAWQAKPQEVMKVLARLQSSLTCFSFIDSPGPKACNLEAFFCSRSAVEGFCCLRERCLPPRLWGAGLILEEGWSAIMVREYYLLSFQNRTSRVSPNHCSVLGYVFHVKIFSTFTGCLKLILMFCFLCLVWSFQVHFCGWLLISMEAVLNRHKQN